ncbi:MAG TPA: lysylphosphatidylglycerol synthase transmembrane domain-containing protein [Fibrobacteraceae bacterium]|nr:lysylphosphatidylglycerol synthase transmembrane domain-containing protein [Fibrobacteraceae bacterium]
MSKIRRLLQGASLVLATLFIWRFWTEILIALSQIQHLGWGFVVLPLLFFFWNAIASIGWWRLLLQQQPVGDVHFWKLVRLRVQGQAINLVFPSGIGGDVYRTLASSYTEKSKGAAALLADKYADSLAEILFIFLGMLAGLLLQAHPSLPWTSLAAVAAVATIALRWCALPLTSLLGRFPRMKRSAQLLRTCFVNPDIRKNISLALLLHLLERLLMLTEIWWAAQALHQPISWGTALFASACASCLGLILAFMPGRIGSLEGGFPLAFSALSLSPTHGLALALARRTRQILVTAVGILLLLWDSHHLRRKGDDTQA